MKSWLIPLGVTYCLLLLPIKGHGQTNFQELPSVSVGIGYFGELFTHPGLVLYGDFALNQDQNQWLTRVNLVHYRHRGHSANTLLLPELLFRRHTTRQSYWEASVGAGSLYQRAHGQVVEFTEGSFSPTTSGRFYFAPSLGLRHGRAFQMSNGHALVPNVGGRIFYQYPFHDFWLMRAAFDVSLSYQIK